MDVRVGGHSRLKFEHERTAYYGTYLEVTPPGRLVWTNEEAGEGGPVTTVTFEENGVKTRLTMLERHPSTESLESAGTGAADMMDEIFAQLDQMLIMLSPG